MTLHKFTEKMLRNHLGGYLYVLRQIYCCEKYLNNDCKILCAFINNACLESLLLHTRVIHEFFYKDKATHDDDFFAKDCLIPAEYKKLKKDLNDYNYLLEKPDYDDICKLMLHPTFGNKKREWDITDFKNKMLNAFKLFLTYPAPRNLIEKNPRWNDPAFREVANLLK